MKSRTKARGIALQVLYEYDQTMHPLGYHWQPGLMRKKLILKYWIFPLRSLMELFLSLKTWIYCWPNTLLNGLWTRSRLLIVIFYEWHYGNLPSHKLLQRRWQSMKPLNWQKSSAQIVPRAL